MKKIRIVRSYNDLIDEDYYIVTCNNDIIDVYHGMDELNKVIHKFNLIEKHGLTENLDNKNINKLYIRAKILEWIKN